MNKKGFTLIELLAVIIILLIIMLIAVPSVLDLIQKAKVDSYYYSATNIVDSAKMYYADGLNDLVKRNSFDGKTNILDKLEYKGEKPINGTLYINEDGDVALSFVYDKVCYTKDFIDYKLNIGYDTNNCNIVYRDNSLSGNDPVLVNGLTPVYYDGNILKKAKTNEKWYDYNNKIWANSILVSEDVRESIKNMASGSVIDTSKILAYFVWIPRYKYAIPSGTGAREISIIFESDKTPKSTGIGVDLDYYTHPAFTFGDKELNGIWVGKFEPSAISTSACYLTPSAGACNNSNQIPRIIPNVRSLKVQQVINQVKTAQKFGTIAFGIDSNSMDSRMMKASEWGAVAYLSNSKYGINKEIRINNNRSYLSGCGALVENGIDTSTCEIKYGEAIDFLYPQSTTGNITGIFDMNGGSDEYVMAVGLDSNSLPYSGYSEAANSGYNGRFSMIGGPLTTGEDFPNIKYYNTFGSITPATACSGGICKGYALSETDSWYGDRNSFINNSNAWITYGGTYAGASLSGIFSRNREWSGGAQCSSCTFRVVMSNK